MEHCPTDGGPGSPVPWALFGVSTVINLALVGVLLLVLRVLKQCSDGSTKSGQHYSDMGRVPLNYVNETFVTPGAVGPGGQQQSVAGGVEVSSNPIHNLPPPTHQRTRADNSPDAVGQEVPPSAYDEVEFPRDPSKKYENIPLGPSGVEASIATDGVRLYEGLEPRPVYANAERPPVYQELKPK